MLHSAALRHAGWCPGAVPLAPRAHLQVGKDRDEIKKRFIALKNLCRSMAEGVSKKKQDRALGQLKELQQQFRFMDEEYKTFRGEVGGDWWAPG